MPLFPGQTTTRDKAFMGAGGVAFWALHKPLKRGKMIYRVSNWIRLGPAGSSLGLGQIAVGAVKFGGAALGGYLLGSGLLVGGTYIAERRFGAKKGSTQHAIDFVSGNVDSPIDYIPHVNAYRILKYQFD